MQSHSRNLVRLLSVVENTESLSGRDCDRKRAIRGQGCGMDTQDTEKGRLARINDLPRICDKDSTLENGRQLHQLKLPCLRVLPRLMLSRRLREMNYHLVRWTCHPHRYL